MNKDYIDTHCRKQDQPEDWEDKIRNAFNEKLAAEKIINGLWEHFKSVEENSPWESPKTEIYVNKILSLLSSQKQNLIREVEKMVSRRPQINVDEYLKMIDGNKDDVFDNGYDKALGDVLNLLKGSDEKHE